MFVRSIPYLLWVAVAAQAVCAGDAPPDTVDVSVAPFFRPYIAEVAKLSPDGRHVAVGVHEGGRAKIALVDLESQQVRKFDLAEAGSGNGVAGLAWHSPQQLLFALGSRGVGLLTLPSGEMRPILKATDMDYYRPSLRLGTPRLAFGTTADMPADASRRVIDGFDTISIPAEGTLLETQVSGDMFGGAMHRPNRARLIPHLLGGSGPVWVELRTDRDPLEDASVRRTELLLPANTFVTDSRGLSGLGRGAPMDARLGRVSQQVVYPAIPHIVLEFETERWRRRELTWKESWLRVLADTQGRPRLALAGQGVRREILYRAADGKRWTPLNKLLAKGVEAGFTVKPADLLGPRAVPLGFDPEDDLLYVASNLETDTFVLRAIDLGSGRFTDLEVADPDADLVEPTDLVRDDVLVFDPHRRTLAGVRLSGGGTDAFWFDPELRDLQRALDRRMMPLRSRILEWDTARNRFLIDVSGPGNPGGFHIYDRAAGQLHACGRRAPWLTDETLHAVHEFGFDAADGRKLSGYITIPRRPRLEPAPVLVYFHDGPWFRTPPVFDRGAQALASLGFAVVQVNYRGSSGSGRAHLMAIHDGFDRAVLDDVQAVLGRAAARLPVNPRLVAALGNGFGGYLALRAVQLEPETFRCAVAINTPADLEDWCAGGGASRGFLGELRRSFLGADRAMLREASALAAARETTRPVLVVHGTENAYVPESVGLALHAALRASPGSSSYFVLEGAGHSGWSRGTTAGLFAELGRFFNATIYSYAVEMGPATVEP